MRFSDWGSVSATKQFAEGIGKTTTPDRRSFVVVDEFVERVEFCDPEEVFARVVAQNLKVLHLYSAAVGNTGRERAGARGKVMRKEDKQERF